MSNETQHDPNIPDHRLSAALQAALRESTPGDPTPSAELRTALAARLNELSSQSHSTVSITSEFHSSGEVIPMNASKKSSWARVAATLVASGCAAALAIAILLPKRSEPGIAKIDENFKKATDITGVVVTSGIHPEQKVVDKLQDNYQQAAMGRGLGGQPITGQPREANYNKNGFTEGTVPPFPGIGFNPAQPGQVQQPGEKRGASAPSGTAIAGTTTQDWSKLSGSRSERFSPAGGGVATSGPMPADPYGAASPSPTGAPNSGGKANDPNNQNAPSYTIMKPIYSGDAPSPPREIPYTIRKPMASPLAPSSATPLPAIKNPEPQQATLGQRVDASGQTLPSAMYSTDDIQYYPNGPKFKLAEEAKLQARYNYEKALEANRQAPHTVSEHEINRLSHLARQDSPASVGGEQYEQRVENIFQGVRAEPLSTFSIDVDTASYTNCRRFLDGRQLPPTAAVRVEEFINYFRYDYPQPTGKDPFAVNMEMADCPWTPNHKLLRVGLKGKEIDRRERPESNLVFLVDVSGSMSSEDKLPLLRDAMHRWVNELSPNDRVTIVTYAGDAGLRLPTTRGDQKDKLHAAIETLQSGGSTHGSAGIKLAYEQATANFLEDGGVNRVLWATDGDLNVGTTGDDELVELITNKAKTGVFLTVLGVGTGNLKDAKLEKMADKGNGVYAYLDSPKEARKVLVEQMSGTTITIAKDVKIQIEFNPAEIAGYRLIGYENRILAAEDFANDKKDAGEIGAGHTVTAFYEIIPVGADDAKATGPAGEPLKYQAAVATAGSNSAEVKLSDAAKTGELLTLKLRFKQPDGHKSELREFPLTERGGKFTAASKDFQFAGCVAQLAMILRDSQYRGTMTTAAIAEIAAATKGEDKDGSRAEFVELVKRVQELGK